jgi:DNA-binding MarR family transcriptional regulator
MSGLTKTQIGMLQQGAAHRDGVVRPLARTNYDKANAKRALADLEASGLIEPNAHGDHYITDAGRDALAALAQPHSP